MKKWLLIAVALTALPSCTDTQPDLKSPCVGIAGSPCAWRPVNAWWDPDEG